MSDLRGETIRWTFDDGPTKGKSFEHTFNEDGSVEYKMDGSNKVTRENKYELIETTDNIVVVSYLGSSGWTLTAVLDEKTHEVTAIASNAKDLVIQHGHFEHLRRAAS